MRYFDQAFLDFFKELKENNTREWFEDHKKIYEKEVKQPFNELVAEMINRISQVDPEVQVTPRQCVFRLYRDVRFSKDKTPYKTHASAYICKGGKKTGQPGFYFRFRHDSGMCGGGVYQTDKTWLNKIRSEIVYSMEEFDKLVSNRKFKAKFGTIQGDKNKIIPKDFREDLERQPLIANKQFYYMTDLPAETVLRDDLPDLLMEHYHVTRPLNQFFARAIAEDE